MTCVGFEDPHIESRVMKAEKAAFLRVMDWLNDNVHGVTHQVVVVEECKAPDDYPGGGGGGRFFPMLCTANMLIDGRDYDQFVYGRTLENTNRPGQEERGAWYQEWWRRNRPRGGCEMLTPLVTENRGRPHALYDLPPALVVLTLSCIDPNPFPCGKCEKCNLTADAKQMLARGVNPDAIFSYQLKMRNAGPYVGMRGGLKRYGAKSGDVDAVLR